MSDFPKLPNSCVSGPCGGKTSSLNHLKEILTQKGFTVFTCPEAATLLASNGTHFPGFSEDVREKLLIFEEELIKLEIAMENALRGMARTESKPVVVLCDRGLMDIRAYVTKEIWETLLQRVGFSNEDLLGRYDIVCHLVTTALDAEEFYTTSNNQARRETAEEARNLDMTTFNCWTSHPELHRIANEGKTFQQKLEHTTNLVVQYLDNQNLSNI